MTIVPSPVCGIGVIRIAIGQSRSGLMPLSFSAAFAKLLELGVPTSQFAGEPWSMGAK